MITRLAAAKLLGKSLTTVRRLEGSELTPKIIGGVHYFDELEVRTLTLRKSVSARNDVNGDSAAEIFALFDRGDSPVKVVRETRVHPDVVEKLFGQWARMLGTFVVRPEDQAQLEAIRGMVGTFPIRDAATLLDNVRQSVHPNAVQCGRCKRRPARFCGDCKNRIAAQADG